MLLKQIIPQDFCLQCFGCCRFSQQESIWHPQILEEERQRLAEVMLTANPAQGNFTPLEKAADKIGGEKERSSLTGFICSYLKLNDNKCKIYSTRPFECQLYPFLFNRKNAGFFLSLDLNCAYVSQNNKDQQFQQYTRSLMELIQTAEYLNIFRNNPRLFQAYEGVLDLVEIKL